MESLVKLFYDWEIQLLVLLSFLLQLFLYFTGGLRRHSTNMIVKLSIWIAYLGADIIAVYALGYLFRHSDATTGRDTLRGTHPLAFFWAPFLLIHLGGQDTVTAFAIEDNNLWLRHLLNLVVQSILALYIFWKSIGRHSLELLVSGIFVFVAGIIKYGERIWSLKCGSFESLRSSTGNQYRHRLPEVIRRDVDYYNIVYTSLHSMLDVLYIFAARNLPDDSFIRRHIHRQIDAKPQQKLNVLEIELGMMYDDLYTKALVLRTRSGIILRCISQIFMVVSFILFVVGDIRSYRRPDVAITYSLFIGSFFLEHCAVLLFMKSPWTWAWLKARRYNRLARFSWFLFSSDLIGCPEKKPLWSNAMGQYSLSSWLMGSSTDQPRSSKVRKLAALVGAEKEKIFLVSKLLDTEYVNADKEMVCLAEGLNLLDSREWPNLGPCLKHALFAYGDDFGFTIVLMHMVTELHLSKYPHSDVEADAAADTTAGDTNELVEICRKLSRYMMYLLVTHPSILPLDASAAATLQRWQVDIVNDELRIVRELESLNPKPSKETLEEIKDLWILLLIYAASRSRPEIHAAQLARGGEPLTILWLLLEHYGFRSYPIYDKFELTGERSGLVLFQHSS